VIRGGARWLGTYAVVVSFGFSAVAIGFAITIALFWSVGPRRTRVIAQVLAAIIGAAFVIALQVSAILSYGTVSRFDMLRSDRLGGMAPRRGSVFYSPPPSLFVGLCALPVVGTRV